MFERLKNWIGGLRARIMGLRNIGDATSDRAKIGTEMESRIEEWMNLYRGQFPWATKSHNHHLDLPATVASEMARLVTLEMQVTITGKNERAKFLDEQLNPLRERIRQWVEYGCAGGGLMFKPYISGQNITIDVAQADMFYPISFNSAGRIESAAFVEQKTVGGKVYNRVEKHKRQKDGYLITNEAFRSQSASDRGVPCPLSEVPDWADIQPEVTISGLDVPLFAYFRIPQGNTTDPASPLGVSVFARAIRLAEDADVIYDGYLWEYQSGQRAIDASEDAFKKVGGLPVIPTGWERLFRMNKFSTDDENTQDLFKDFSPEMRDDAYKRGLNTIFEQVEDKCGLSRGILSLQETEAKTATEIKMSRQRSYATVTDIQKSLETALDGLIAAMDALCDLYTLAAAGEYEAAYVWDDSIIVDAETERANDRQDVASGLMNAYEYRMKWYGEDEETARAKSDEAKQKSDNDIMGFGSGLGGDGG